MFFPESFVFISICLLFRISRNVYFEAKTLFLLRIRILGFKNPPKISPQAPPPPPPHAHTSTSTHPHTHTHQPRTPNTHTVCYHYQLPWELCYRYWILQPLCYRYWILQRLCYRYWLQPSTPQVQVRVQGWVWVRAPVKRRGRVGRTAAKPWNINCVNCAVGE